MFASITSDQFVLIICIVVCGGFLLAVGLVAWRFLDLVRSHGTALAGIKPAQFDLIRDDVKFQWQHWLYNQTRNSKMAPPSRVDAIHEFDASYFHRGDYIFIVKSKEYAPFIGLLLTAFAAWYFYSFELKNLGNASPGMMVERVLPLLMGVASGAMLNLVCSVIVQCVNSKVSAYRMAALEWFDNANRHVRETLAEDVQTQIVARITETNTNLADQITQFLAHALVKTEQFQNEAEQLRHSALAATRAAEIASGSAARAMQALERDIAQLCQILNANVTTLTDTLCTNAQQLTEFSVSYRNELQAISNSTLELGRAWLSLQPEIRIISESSTELAKVTRTFREALGPAAETIRSASQQYALLTNDLSDSARAVHGATDQLQTSLENHTQALEAVNGSVQDTLIPACRTLVNSVGQLERNTQQLDQQTLHMATSLDATSAGLTRFENVSKSFEHAVNNQFLPAVKSLADVPGIVQGFRQATDETGETLRDSGTAIRRAFEDNRVHLTSASTVTGKLQSLVESASSAAAELKTTATAFSTTTQNLQDTSNFLSNVNVQLGPVSVQLSEFLNSLSALSNLSPDVEALSQHLRELDKVAATAAKTQSPLKSFANVLREIQDSLHQISVERPGIWEQVLVKLGLKRPR